MSDSAPRNLPLPLAATPDAGDAASEPQVGRRGFLGAAALCLGACGGALGTVAAAIVATPLSEEGQGGERWFDLGAIERFPDGGALKVAVRGPQRDAFRRFADRSVGRVVVVRQGEEVQVFSAVCPHNGCDVFVAPEDLVCPCHDSHFGFDGERTTGETPRGLDPLPHKLAEGRLQVRYLRFEVGTAERKEIS